MRFTLFTALVFTGLVFQAGGQSVSDADTLVLRDRIDEQDTLVTLDLYHEEKSLGGPLLQRITDGSLSVGRPSVKALTGSRADKWVYYVVNQPFTLHRLEGGRYYESAVFQVTLDDPEITAEDLFPKNVTTELKLDEKLSVTPAVKAGFKFGEASISAGVEKTKSYLTLLPLITAYGVGEREFYWEYKAPEKQPLLPGAKQAAIILRVRRGVSNVVGQAVYKAVIVEKSFGGLYKSREATTGSYPVAWQLAVADHQVR
jgi:hypothetical protein